MYYFINENSLYTLRFRFICKCETVDQELQDDGMAWENALTMVHINQDRETSKYTDKYIADIVKTLYY